MKKIVSIILASILALSLCACNTVSREEYEDLNARVSALEQQANNGNTNSLAETTNSVDPVETTESVIVPETTSQVSSNYTLEGMTAEEIYAECQKIFQTIPQTNGMTISEYYSCLEYAPNTTGPVELGFPCWTFDGYEYNIMNCIRAIEVSGLTEQMDGTVVYSAGNNGDSGLYIYTTVYINLTDYETASAVYNLMISDSKYSGAIQSNNQAGTTWYTSAQSPAGSAWAVAELFKLTDPDGNDYYSLVLTDLVV